MTSVDEVVAAWVEWDRSPRADHTAAAKEAAISAAGLDSLRLHDRVAVLRQAGVDVETAVRQAAAEQGAVR